MTVVEQRATHDVAALAVLDRAVEAAGAYGRADLARRLKDVRVRVTDPRVRVLVVGEFKQGKSSLVNAAVNADVCPVDDDVATSVPTSVHYADAPVAVALHAPPVSDGEPRRQTIDADDVAAHVSEAGNPANERNLWAVEIGVPRALLRSGLVLVDTPGVGGLGSAHSATTIGALPSADAVLLCTDASQELTAAELAFLKMARDLCPTIACVLTKVDFYSQWRRIAELDRGHLSARGMKVSLIATSAFLRTQAIARNDRELDAESGYPNLLTFLRREVVGKAGLLARRTVARTVDDVTDHLAHRFTAEREALADPSRSAELVARLEQAQEHATALRSRSARWQQTLSDGFADLSADADHDLRNRMRDVTRRLEAAIADIDPGSAWEELEQWLYRTVTGEVAATYAMVARRGTDLSGEVSAHFTDDRTRAVPVFGADLPLSILRQITPAQRVDTAKMGVGARGLLAMRSSYGGVMMMGVVGGTIGLGLLNPLSVGFGVLLGRKAIRDERERSLAQRRLQAKQACRVYVDEVSFTVGKDARDGLRRLQRTLRDTFTAQADELQRSTGEALTVARQALHAGEAQRTRRLRDVDAELLRIRELREHARNLLDGDAVGGGR